MRIGVKDNTSLPEPGAERDRIATDIPISASKCSIEEKNEKTQDLCGFDGPSALLLDRLPICQKTKNQSRKESISVSPMMTWGQAGQRKSSAQTWRPLPC